MCSDIKDQNYSLELEISTKVIASITLRPLVLPYPANIAG